MGRVQQQQGGTGLQASRGVAGPGRGRHQGRREQHERSPEPVPLQWVAAQPERAQGQYPLVFANILATPLKLLAPLLCAHLAPGGHLVLAGILERQADELKATYAPWLALEVADRDEGWVLMTGVMA